MRATSIRPQSGLRAPAASALFLTGLVVLALVAGGCAPDLKEAVGPVIPLPNVTGQVLRDGRPAAGIKVKLETAPAESLRAEDRTDTEGRFAFDGVEAGAWILKITAVDPGDYARIAWEFELPSADEVYEVPRMEISADGLEADSPDDSAEVDVPSLFRPVTFTWRNPARDTRKVQVRVYRDSGELVWVTDDLDLEAIEWNGLANRGVEAGKLARPGRYTWRLRTDEGSLERSTGSRTLIFREATP